MRNLGVAKMPEAAMGFYMCKRKSSLILYNAPNVLKSCGSNLYAENSKETTLQDTFQEFSTL